MNLPFATHNLDFKPHTLESIGIYLFSKNTNSDASNVFLADGSYSNTTLKKTDYAIAVRDDGSFIYFITCYGLDILKMEKKEFLYFTNPAPKMFNQWVDEALGRFSLNNRARN